MSLQMETPRRHSRSRRGSRTPFNPLKSIDNSMEIGIIESFENNLDNCEDLGIQIRSEAFDDHYTVEDNLGRGKFATVKRCVCKQTGRTFAAKFQRKRRKAKCARGELLHEVRMLASCRVHPRFVTIREVFETRHEMIIVTDYAPGGELYKHMEEREGGFTERQTQHLMRQTLEALAFLHARSIVHMDIKPQNILMCDTEPTSDILLCDLGFSRDTTSGEDIREIIGTPDFVAPEILNYEPLTTASDMWSAGVLAYMLLTGTSPFAGDDKMQTFSNISVGKVDFPEEHFKDVSNQAKDFIHRLLVRAPNKRMTATDCLEHPWLEEEEPESHDLSPAMSRDSLDGDLDIEEEEEEESRDQETNQSSRSISPVDSLEDSDTNNKDSTLITKAAISHYTIELVKKKLETLVEQENDENEKCDTSIENCDKDKDDNSENVQEQSENILDKCDSKKVLVSSNKALVSSVKDKIEKYENSAVCNKNQKLSSEFTDCTNQRKALKELSNQRTASVIASPLASPIGCRRTLTPSPETILEVEPIKKHHCRRDSDEIDIIIKTDLQVNKVESKVWDLGETVFEDNHAIVSKREKEIAVTSS